MNSMGDQIKSGNDVKTSDEFDEDDDNAPIPGTVFNKRQARLLKYVVIFLGLLLVAGFALLIGIIAYRASQPGKTPPPIAPPGVTIPGGSARAPVAGAQPAHVLDQQAIRKFRGTIAKNAVLVASTINGNRYMMTLKKRNGDLQLILIDLASWKITGTALLQQGK